MEVKKDKKIFSYFVWDARKTYGGAERNNPAPVSFF